MLIRNNRLLIFSYLFFGSIHLEIIIVITFTIVFHFGFCIFLWFEMINLDLWRRSQSFLSHQVNFQFIPNTLLLHCFHITVRWTLNASVVVDTPSSLHLSDFFNLKPLNLLLLLLLLYPIPMIFANSTTTVHQRRSVIIHSNVCNSFMILMMYEWGTQRWFVQGIYSISGCVVPWSVDVTHDWRVASTSWSAIWSKSSIRWIT